MNCELVTVGTELLLGFTVDTNSAEIGRALASAGVRVVRRTAVPDDPAAIRDAVASALARTGTVITTGGLGPTADDITKKTVAELFGAEPVFDASVWADLEARFARLGRTPSANNRGQAEVPAGAVVLPNRWGTAPGLWLEGAPGLVVMLPGVPVEMRNLLVSGVLPRLAARPGPGGVIRSVTVRTTGIAESTLAERLGDIDERLAPLTLAYLPGLGSVDLRATAWNLPQDEADRRLAAAADLLAERAGEHAYGRGDDDLAALVLARTASTAPHPRRGGVVHRRAPRRPPDRRAGQLEPVSRGHHQLLRRGQGGAPGGSPGDPGGPRRRERPGGRGHGRRRCTRPWSGRGGLDHRHCRPRRGLDGEAGGDGLARVRTRGACRRRSCETRLGRGRKCAAGPPRSPCSSCGGGFAACQNDLSPGHTGCY